VANSDWHRASTEVRREQHFWLYKRCRGGTSSASSGREQMQQSVCAISADLLSLDHLVGDGKQRWRHVSAAIITGRLPEYSRFVSRRMTASQTRIAATGPATLVAASLRRHVGGIIAAITRVTVAAPRCEVEGRARLAASIRRLPGDSATPRLGRP
jgi:hypothetical protein